MKVSLNFSLAIKLQIFFCTHKSFSNYRDCIEHISPSRFLFEWVVQFSISKTRLNLLRTEEVEICESDVWFQQQNIGTGWVDDEDIFSNVFYSTGRTRVRLHRAQLGFASGAKRYKEIFILGALHALDVLQKDLRSIHVRLGSCSVDSKTLLKKCDGHRPNQVPEIVACFGWIE